MDINCKIFSEDSEEFPWDENAVKAFKNIILEKNIKCRMDDIFLLGFLRARKYDMERSLQLLKNYYSIRKKHPEYFKNLLPSKLEHGLSLKCMQFLPQPDQKGRYIYIYQFSNWDTSICDLTDSFRTMLLFTDFQLNFHRTQENSVVFIINAEGLFLRHFFQFSPRVLNTIVTIIFRNTYQLRIKEIHFVNTNTILTAFLSLFIPLLPVKIKNRLFVHNEMHTLHKFVHPQYLPAEYGGELPNFDPTEVNEMIKENPEFFRKNEEDVDNYEESQNNFAEGRFRYIGEDHINEELKEILKNTEAKFNRFVENPESYLAAVEQDSELEITRL